MVALHLLLSLSIFLGLFLSDHHFNRCHGISLAPPQAPGHTFTVCVRTIASVQVGLVTCFVPPGPGVYHSTVLVGVSIIVSVVCCEGHLVMITEGITCNEAHILQHPNQTFF